ncbi:MULTISPECIES: UPF0489 family protein [Galbibacter]|uniref:UPF0489 family protein n=1 Tax=Galbibacter pacificus TaxID=2996052 RepID=A0ABT6FSD9_9FLAO|nr:UPF0489 family protein [Galbibacter pacificus]MDG3582870.1 UPF0489 family protein [Galbibacter pacificus]MDG3586011.1 UPF0489 family protein [Galbibacter pacificus]
MKNKATIPLFIVEEHNEAFYIWINFLKHRKDKKNYTLLHFDDHSDMTTLRVNTPLENVFEWSDKKLSRFTYEELTIASFIKVASFIGVFNKIIWCKVDHKVKMKKDFFITSYNNDAKNLISGNQLDANPLLNNPHQIVNYEIVGLKDFEEHDAKKVLLDIDLDFFSCIIQPENNNEIIIEVSEEEYLNFNHDKYHPIRFICNSIQSRVHENSYFLIINYYQDIFPSPRKVSEAIIKKRIQDFIGKLKEFSINPDLITICRSVYSGYTPRDQWRFIEQELKNGLSQIYKMRENSIASF